MPKAKIIIDACCKVKNAHIKGRSGKGKAACGVLIINEKGEETTFKKYLGEMTVPEAEFRALIFALDQAVSIVRYDIEVWMDSELVIKWMNGEYRMKKDHIRPLFDEAKKYSQRYKSVEFLHHSRKSTNAKKADKLANEAFMEVQN
ncbi:MAG: ribonuclease HI family protein [candidate division Zixibacteria bacterium]|nr:ribonuclease HI family protein [candidate division Zixibacteria bacterium]